MTDTPSTPDAGQADDQPGALDPPAMRAAAELYMIDVLGVPDRLLPPSLEGHPLQVLSVALRRAVLRRLRTADRLKVAAATLTAQTIQLIETAGRRHTPPPGHPLSPNDVDRITELTAQLRELDTRVADETGVLVTAAQAYARRHGATDALPGVEDRAHQRGLGPRE